MSITSVAGTTGSVSLHAPGTESLLRTDARAADFDAALREFEVSRDPSAAAPSATTPSVTTPSVDGGHVAPSRAVRTAETADRAHERLAEIAGALGTNSTLSVQSLMQLQLEVHQLTMGLETTTKAVSETSTNLKQTLQQQI